ncbi:NHL repeat-containing protein 2-like [Pollicipes pollicipes]|uniref:NHL repeat-containing protein 2-like n=1 Tax=Pollicipes pollicipes TaxID=41117 RepID=UPI0018855294|nr:NHL repeat-containing protein 2-like [Pollicipes pollicipes]
MEELTCASLYFIEKYKTAPQEDGGVIIEEFLDQQLGAEYNLDVTFSPEWEWFNVSRPLEYASDLDDKLVVLDFFTYCCINCLHVLPSLHQLERDHSIEDGLVIVGVHSAKFENERVSSNIAAALQRYDIAHPVVNDAQLVLWRRLEIACWPTLVILGPGCRPLLLLVGEGHSALLGRFVSAALRRLRGRLGSGSLPLAPAARPPVARPLRFPGKLCRLDARRLVLSDSGHHRLLVTDNSGAVLHVIGGPTAGFLDGKLGESKFSSPQGVAADGDVIYVADTENHAIRKVDLQAGLVETLAGTGQRGDDLEGGGVGRAQVLASPWDLCLVGDRLYLAMAGSHQIWALFLRDGTLFGKRPCPAGTCLRVAGSGQEENRNNSYPQRAAFAQPSGLTWDAAGARLLVADSESSSVRQVALADGAVRAVVGGARDPTNLFEFGDVDSAEGPARLQHPLGVAWSAADAALYVADTYNHKLKLVLADGRGFSCRTLAGSSRGDQTGPLLEAQFNEPGGLLAEPAGDQLLVADTNNHCIKRVDLAAGTVDELDVRMTRDSPDRPTQAVTSSATVRSAGGAISLSLEVLLSGVSLTEGAPHSWRLDQLPSGWSAAPPGPFSVPLTVQLHAPPLRSGDAVRLRLHAQLFLCSPAGLCFPRELTFELLVEARPSTRVFYYSYG